MPVCDYRHCARPATHTWVCPCGGTHLLAWCEAHDRGAQARMTREGWERLRVPVG